MVKINTVKVDKKQLIKEIFMKKGLPELLSEVNFKMDRKINTTTKLLKKFTSAIKRPFKKEFNSLSRDLQISFFEKIRIHDIYQVKLEHFESDNPKFTQYVERMLKHCSTLEGTQEKLDIIKVTIQNGTEEWVGYSLLNGEIKNSYHRSSRYYPSDKKEFGSLYLLDITSLIAETIAIQSLVQFVENNLELVQYIFVRAYLYPVGFHAKRTPKSEEFKKDFLKIADEYHLEYEGAIESDYVDKESYLFYGEKISNVGSKYYPLNDRLLHFSVEEFIKQSEYAQYRANEEYADKSEYARAFQTKKQIKLTHQDRMEDNVFLLRYGYVELDNDVDLDKFSIIEDNFKELIQKVHIPQRSDYSFRIKKLGKHRAAGVFYPYFKTTIFDLNHPNAYMHECFHQIDSIFAEGIREDYFSETMRFRPIYDAYKEKVLHSIELLPDDDSFKQEWDSKNKYNKDYYLKPTEVFARSGEIYISQKGFGENSLFKSENELKGEPIYPFDANFIPLVMKFFDDMFQRISELTPVKQKDTKEISMKLMLAEEKRQRENHQNDDEKTLKYVEQLSLF